MKDMKKMEEIFQLMDKKDLMSTTGGAKKKNSWMGKTCRCYWRRI